MIELADKNFKTTAINRFKDLKENKDNQEENRFKSIKYNL